jgi:succinoglycan biosynthesis protein ExoH
MILLRASDVVGSKDQLSSIDRDISERMAILRYVMIFGIVVLHMPPYVPLTETAQGVFPFIKALFQHAIFRASVPVLTFISGYLLFKAKLDLNFIDLLAKKTRTILIPLVIFNVPVAIAVYFIQSRQSLAHDFTLQLYPFNLEEWANALFGLFASPINYPLNFLRDLYVLSLLSPIIGLLVRRSPLVAFLVVFVTFWFNLDRELIQRNVMPIVFCIGAIAAAHDWNLKKLDRFALPFLLVFLMFCVLIVAFEIESRNYFRLLSPLLLWPAASLLSSSKIGYWLASLSKYSFLTFMTHGPLLLMASVFYKKSNSGLPYWMFWALCPIAVAALVIGLHKIAYRYIPKTMSMLLGGR